MKRILLLASVPLLFTLFFATPSCTKTKDVTTTIYDTVVYKDTLINRDTVVLTTPKNPIFGTWTGVYYVNGAPAADSFYYTFYIRSDNTMLTEAGGEGGSTAGYGEGPWTLNGTTFSATTAGLSGTTPEAVQTLTATYDSVRGLLYNGTFYVTGGNSESGTFRLLRIQ